MRSKSLLQHGFTLIELMVVLVIVSVLLSAAVIAISPSESAKLRQQTSAVQGVLQAACDQAAFDQHIYAILPSQTGLEVVRQQQGKWQTVTKPKGLAWQDGIEADWTLNTQLTDQYAMPKAGWLCWPSGELMAGAIELTLAELQQTLRWNEMRQFERDASQGE